MAQCVGGAARRRSNLDLTPRADDYAHDPSPRPSGTPQVLSPTLDERLRWSANCAVRRQMIARTAGLECFIGSNDEEHSSGSSRLPTPASVGDVEISSFCVPGEWL